MSDERIQAVALALTPGIGSKTIRRLLAVFGTLDAILCASDDQLQTVQGIGPKTASAIRRIELERVAADLRHFDQQGVGVVTWLDASFPTALTPLDDAPLALFYRGAVSPLAWTLHAVAIVGTREPSTGSIDQAETLAAGFAERGWIVVSGLARGIDSAAHRGALDAGGPTLAVLGSGVNMIYPPENAVLARRVLDNGSLLSECHPLARPSALGLTIRNRIITGLSRAVIIVEAGATSGALHAARNAKAQGRLVFAIPNGSTGNAQLLTDGALPLEGVDQVISGLSGSG